MGLGACAGPDESPPDGGADGAESRATVPADEDAGDDAPPQPAPDTTSAQPDTSPADWTIGIVDEPGPPPGEIPGGVPVLTGLSFAGAPGERRVTLDFGESGVLPGYHLEYVDRPLHECGSGRQIHPVGEAWLEIRLTPAAAHTEAGASTLPGNELPVQDVGGLLRVYRTCDFEARVTLVLALESPEPFRVWREEAESRLVVEIRR